MWFRFDNVSTCATGSFDIGAISPTVSGCKDSSGSNYICAGAG